MRYLVKRLDTNAYQTLDGDTWGSFDESYAWHSEVLAKAEARDQTDYLGVGVVVVELAAEKKSLR